MKILFTIWLLLYPLCSTINEYINVKLKAASGQKQSSPDEVSCVCVIELAFYIAIAIILWRHGV